MSNDLAKLKSAARGRWEELLATLGGIEPTILDRRNHPCPKCGGKDRFRFTDNEGDGSVFCNQCAREHGDGFAALQWLRGWTFPQAVATVANYLGTATDKAPTNGEPRVVASYDYRNARGELLYQVVRFDPKDFRQRRPAAKGKWVWTVKGVRMVPYRLPDLLVADPSAIVFIVEGEKDADRLAASGAVATTNAGGAGKWLPEYAEHFRGRRVAIIPDNDEKGRKHAQQVAASLRGIAATIKIVELPALPLKGDVSDWLDGGRTLGELMALMSAVAEWRPVSAVGGKRICEPAPFVPFPTEILPTVIRHFVCQGAKAIGCDPSYIAVPLLAALASAVGNSRRIRIKHSWPEQCVVWSVVVGESGTLKSPAFDLAIAPLSRLQDVAFARWKQEVERHAADKAAYDADLTEWKKKGRKKAEPAPEAPEEPVAVRYMCVDTTVEALAVLLEQQPRGLLMARDELSGWVNSFDAYKAGRGADVAHWLAMHRAGKLTVDRKTGRRVIHVPRAAVSITGGVQPGALAAALVGRSQPRDSEGTRGAAKEHFDNGLAARLLFCMPPKQPKKWTDDDLAPEAMTDIRRLFDDLLALEMGHDEADEQVPIDLPFTEGGKRAWIAFYNAHNQEMAEMAGDLAAAWSKLEGYAARFALLFHLVRVASADPTLTTAAAVDEQSITAGVALSRWFGDEASRVYAIIGADEETPEAREERDVRRIIEARGGEITVRELMQSSRRYRESAEAAEAVLRRMVVRGKATVKTNRHDGGRGRPVDVFVLVPIGNGNTNSESPEQTPISLPLPPDGKPESMPGNDVEEVMEWTG